MMTLNKLLREMDDDASFYDRLVKQKWNGFEITAKKIESRHHVKSRIVWYVNGVLTPRSKIKSAVGE